MVNVNCQPVQVLVVDDHPVVRDGVAAQLSSSRALVIAGYAGSGAEAIDTARRTQPDVILFDIRLSDCLAPEVIPDVLRAAPRAKVVIFTAYPEHASISAALAAGAHGVLVKDAGRGDLVHAVLALAREGNLPQQPSLQAVQVITPREYDVLRRVALGESNPEIAEAMSLTRNTVKSYLQSTLQKLDARNRIEAVAHARQLGLL